MATRSKIGLMLPDGRVKSVYHHWDGYPEWLGRILIESYTDECKINSLLDGGDISTLESDTDWNRTTVETPIVLYYKARGEENCGFKVETYEEFLKCNRGEEYVYLFKSNQWYCFTRTGKEIDLNQEVVECK